MSMLRESPGIDGTPGPVSLRRVLSLSFGGAAVGLFALGLLRPLPAGAPAWAIALPGALCLAASVALLVCTTVGDIVAIIQAARGRTL